MWSTRQVGGSAGVAFQKPACNDENDADYKPERYTNLYSSELFTPRFAVRPSLRHNPYPCQQDYQAQGGLIALVGFGNV